MKLFELISLILELLFFISGPILVIIGFIALKRIKIAKEDIVLRSKREAASLSGLECEKYIEKIIPLINRFNKILEDEKVPEFNVTIGNFFKDDLSKFPNNFMKSWLSILEKNDNIKVILDILNNLESISSYFVNGIADEEIGFLTIGFDFYNDVKKLYPYLALVRNKREKNYFDNIVCLYKIWAKRIEKFELEKQAENLENLTNNIKKKLSSLKIKEVGIIGAQ